MKENQIQKNDHERNTIEVVPIKVYNLNKFYENQYSYELSNYLSFERIFGMIAIIR